MMTSLRKHYKKILIGVAIVIIPSFVMWGGFFGRGTGEKNPEEEALIIVNKEKVPLRVFRRGYAMRLEQLRSQYGQNLDESILEMLGVEDQVLDSIIDELLTLQEIRRLKVPVSDNAVEQQLKSFPRFQKDGRFDAAAWNAFINSPVNWAALYASMKDQIASQRVLGSVTAAAKVTEQELRQRYASDNEKVKIKYFTLRGADFQDQVEVTDEDAGTYYDDHKEEFRHPDQVKAKYAKIEIKPSEKDEESVLAKAQEVRDKIVGGADFGELATEFSEDPGSKDKGGDLGWFTKGRMVKEFEEAAFGLEPGTVSEPVKTTYGYHIIKVEDKKTEDDEVQVKARHILLRTEASDETLEKIAATAESLAESAREKGLDATAAEMSIEVKETDRFDERTRFLRDVGMAEEFVAAAFSLDEGAVAGPVEIQRNYFIIEVVEKRDSAISPFEEVEERIKTTITREKANELGAAKVEKLAKQVERLDDLAGIDESYGDKVKESTEFAREASVPGVGRSEELSELAFALAPGKLAGPILVNDRPYLFEVVEHIPVDWKKFDEEKEELKESMLRTKQVDITRDWLEYLRSRARITINRELLKPPEPEETETT